VPDSALILTAYQKWGLDCVNHLVGDWSFAIWEPNRRRLLLARDQTGNTGLCYYYDGKIFAFASCLHGLLALDQIPQALDEMHLTGLLVAWAGQGTGTAYQNINRLPPGHCMVLENGDLQVQQYWQPQAIPPLKLNSDAEYLEAFQELYEQAVRSAMQANTPLAATLSGGLDSGSLCVLAADQLAESGQRLQTYSGVPRYETGAYIGANRFGDERPYIEATANFNGGMDLHYIDAAQVTPLEGIRQGLKVHHEPGHAAGNQYWLVNLLDTVRQHGVQTLLTAQGGNGTISYSGLKHSAVERWLGGGTWKSFLGELRAWKTHQDRSWIGVLRNQVLKPLLPAPLMQWYVGARAGAQPWERYSALNPQLARELDLLKRMRAKQYDPTFNLNRGEQLNFFSPEHVRSLGVWMENSAAYQLEICDPTLDRRLVEFCLAIPRNQYARDGRKRLLVRRAMEGRMPREVLWNEKRGLQAADIGPRLLEPHSAAQVQQALDQLKGSPQAQRFLDLPRMQAIFDQSHVHLDAEISGQIRTILLRGIGVGLFLLQFEESL
jgi:asparagine synthase (glutamine-hydrolysing)